MRYLIYFCLIFFHKIYSIEANNNLNFLKYAYDQKEEKNSLEEDVTRKITPEDLLTYKLMDNNYINPQINFEFDIIKEILNQDYKLNLMTPDERTEFLAKKQEKLRNFVDMNKIKKIAAFDFQTNRFNYTRSDNDDYNNRHLPNYVNSNEFRDNIFYYIETGDINKIRISLDNKLDINSRNDRGETLLIYAVICNEIDIARLLIARRANLKLIDNNGLTALDHAINLNDESMINLLKNFSQ